MPRPTAKADRSPGEAESIAACGRCYRRTNFPKTIERPPATTRRSQRREYWAIVYGKKCLGSILSPERRSLSPFLPSRPQSRQVARPDKTMIEIARLTGMKVGRHSPEERKTRPCRSQAISDRGTCLQLFSLFLKEKEEKGRQVERKLRYEPTMFQIVFCRLVN